MRLPDVCCCRDESKRPRSAPTTRPITDFDEWLDAIAQDLINEIDLCQRIKWWDYDLAGSLYWRGHEAYDIVCPPPPPAHLGAQSAPPPPHLPARLAFACCGRSHSYTPSAHTIRGNCVRAADTRCVAVVCQEHDDTASYPGCAAPSVSTPPSRTATCDTGARTSCPGVVSASTCRSDRGQLPQLQLALARVSSSCPAPLRAVRTGGASWSDAHNVCAHESRARHHLSSLSASRLPSRATGRVRPPNPPSPAPNRPQRSDTNRHLRLPHRLGVSDFKHRVLILPQLLPVLVASLASRIPCREPRYHD